MISGQPIRPSRLVRTLVVAGVLAAVATAVPLVASDISAASTATKPAAGAIHVYIVSTSLSPTTPNNVLITGAFSDHGTSQKGTMHLTKGTVTVDTSKVKAIVNPSSFGTMYAASCSFTGVATAPATVVRGTGAYAGIHGTLTVTETIAAQGSLLKNGKCNESNNAPALAQDLIATASGTVSF
jgi:hypothetical protein